MGWMTATFAFAIIHCICTSFGIPHNSPESEQMPENIATVNLGNSDLLAELQDEDQKLKEFGNYLSYILANPWPKTGLPILYVEDYNDVYPEDNENPQEVLQEMEEDNGGEIARPVLFKRSRYYRKYPWKRQNSRQTYEAENRYLCQPSKDDVFRLLVALHEARQGNKGRTINFCNRKRPASAIFTNIRFLGKRK